MDLSDKNAISNWTRQREALGYFDFTFAKKGLFVIVPSPFARDEGTRLQLAKPIGKFDLGPYTINMHFPKKLSNEMRIT